MTPELEFEPGGVAVFGLFAKISPQLEGNFTDFSADVESGSVDC